VFESCQSKVLAVIHRALELIEWWMIAHIYRQKASP
jgi:hypothetical protein